MHLRQGAMLAPALMLFCVLTVQADDVALVGTGTVPGNASDLSGLTGNICDGTNPSDCVPMNILGGFGSGIAYAGQGDLFVAVSDRGPYDGVTTPAYPDRFDVFRFTLDTNTQTVTPKLLATRLFVNRLAASFVGESSAFKLNPFKTLRFDPESVRVTSRGNLFVSDEYGPYIYQFDRLGNLLHRVQVPSKFLIDNPNADSDTELSTNTKGRQANRGMEGLAISPDGTALFGLMQNPLIQDGALDSDLDRVGINTRLLKVDLVNGTTQEYVYQIESGNGGKNGMNDIVAVNDHEFLVIERDGKAGDDAKTKKVYQIDLTGATDVSAIESLPETCTAGVDCPFTPVSKTLLIDMLADAYGLKGPSFPEKIEGLAFGPDLSDGRHVLYVTSDNDLDPVNPSYIFAFAIPADLLPGYQPQQFSEPFLSSGPVQDDPHRNSIYADEQ